MYRSLALAVLATVVGLCAFYLAASMGFFGPEQVKTLPSFNVEVGTVDGFAEFRAKVEPTSLEDLWECRILFESLPTHHELTSKVIHSVADALVKMKPDQSFFTSAVDAEGNELPTHYHDAKLSYDASKGEVVDQHERAGDLLSYEDEGDYVRRTSSWSTTDDSTFHDILVVYETLPPTEQLRTDLEHEVEHAKRFKTSVTIRVLEGNKDNRMTWQPVKSDDGSHWVIEYLFTLDQVEASWPIFD